MDRPDILARHSRTRAVQLATLALALAGCDRQQASPQPDNGSAVSGNASVTAAEIVPLPAPTLTRETLLLAIAQAASASAAGKDDKSIQAELKGRQFTFRIRFGCSGPAADLANSGAGWSYDKGSQAMKIRVDPDFSLDASAMAAEFGPGIEAAQGFWIQRPWLFTSQCADVATAVPTNEAGREVAIAQFFTPEDSRVQRRSRPFEAVQKVAEESLPGPEGLDLVLAGRLRELSAGRVIACRPVDPNRRPICVASVVFDRVSVEAAASQAPLAEWVVG